MESPIRGTISDRPWGITVAALGLDSFTGQLTLIDPDERRYVIAFYKGAVVAASSPLAVDSVVRVALTTKQITPAQGAELKARLAKSPEPDEIAVIGKLFDWKHEQTEKLRNDVIARAAARTFAIERGTYTLEDRIGSVGLEGNVDVRAIVYLGVRLNLSNERLAYDLRQLGQWFVLKPKTVVDLSGFGFGEEETPVLEALRGGTNLASLEAKHRDVDPRTAQAVLYALAVCDAVVCCEPPAMTATVETPIVPSEPMVTRVPTPRQPLMSRVPTPREPTMTRVPTRRNPSTTARLVPRQRPPKQMTDTTPYPVLSKDREHTTSPHGVPVLQPTSPESGFVDMRTDMRTTMRPNQLTLQQVQQLIAARTQLLDHGADHFTLLGLPPGASPEEARAAYVELARYLEPKTLQQLGIRDESYTARRLFAQICIAVTVLTDPARRRDYVATLRR